jgi:hypothetical protein
VTVTAEPVRAALDVLRIEQADAWFEYGESCRIARAACDGRCEEIESWAWNRLQTRLTAIAARRHRLEP